ncbi:PAS domain protein [Streptomyces himastatinicus ATCC 53653]|uniref:PAS domain protein n=1 Tax=Streptomyces himastatinicus ATCC 53653 TaxID=457427 RepID=D9WVD8_9ACTN|nr:PAS domain-containing protein [Streptomyces himastatinicus]EFL22315.1 PAS domain protein [Streptomyces himastatinicus ATCC 53653]
MSRAQDFGAELTDFRRRVDELRTARALPSQERLSVLDAALFELQHVVDVLWPRYEELAAASHIPPGGRADPQEQQLLRALFQRLPIPVVLLDRESVVRRMNFAATQLFNTRAGYATGRPLTSSLRRDGQAALRSQVAAVARGEGGRSLTVHLSQPGPDGALRVTLAALRPPGEPQPAVLAAFQPDRGTPVATSSATLPAARTAGRDAVDGAAPQPDLAEVTRHAELLDLVDDMATALLRVTLAGDGPEEVIGRAAELLHGRFADWVIADLAEDGTGAPRRMVALGPPEAAGERTASLAEQDPAGCPLVADALDDGVSALRVSPPDANAFGRDATGAPVLVREEVTSLLCIPLRVSPTSPVLGALSLFRTGGRSAFEMAEAGAADRVSRHIALALSRPRVREG